MRYSSDKRFAMIDTMRDRKSMFEDYISELGKREKQKKLLIKEKVHCLYLLCCFEDFTVYILRVGF